MIPADTGRQYNIRLTLDMSSDNEIMKIGIWCQFDIPYLILNLACACWDVIDKYLHLLEQYA